MACLHKVPLFPTLITLLTFLFVMVKFHIWFYWSRAFCEYGGISVVTYAETVIGYNCIVD